MYIQNMRMIYQSRRNLETLAYADENKPIKDSSGKIIDYERIQLDKPVTVYNLFGIGLGIMLPVY